MRTHSRAQVLVIDDEEHVRRSVRDYLVYRGMDVVTAPCAEEGLQKLRQITPDLIVLDMTMPGIGGTGFLRQIAGDDGRPVCPVLVLTARSAMREFFESIDVDGFLAKPCTETQLYGEIQRILEDADLAREQERDETTVILGESDARQAQSVAHVLTAAGYSVAQVGTGPEIIEQAAALHPDAIVMRRELPGGMEPARVASLLSLMSSLRTVPVILYGGASSDALEPIDPTLPGVAGQLLSTDPEDVMQALRAALNDRPRARSVSRILLIDDEEHVLRTVGDYLGAQGFRVTTARDGEEGLAKLGGSEFDLIILDIAMPGMGGMGFLRNITTQEGKPSHPVLVLTARAAMREFFSNIDVDGFLAKPCTETQLFEEIRRILGAGRPVLAGGTPPGSMARAAAPVAAC